MIYDEDPFRRRLRKLTARWKRQERSVWMTTNLAKWASNNGQIIKSRLPNDRRAKFLQSEVGFAYDLLRYECYLGNVGSYGLYSIKAPKIRAPATTQSKPKTDGTYGARNSRQCGKNVTVLKIISQPYF